MKCQKALYEARNPALWVVLPPFEKISTSCLSSLTEDKDHLLVTDATHVPVCVPQAHAEWKATGFVRSIVLENGLMGFVSRVSPGRLVLPSRLKLRVTLSVCSKHHSEPTSFLYHTRTSCSS